MRRNIALLLSLVLVVGFVPGAEAQSSTLSGQVLDQDGQPVVGAQVYLNQWGIQDKSEPQPEEDPDCGPDGACPPASSMPYREDNYHHAQTETDSQGRYSFDAYNAWADVSVQREGYAGAYQGVQVEGPTVLDLKMLKYPAKDATIEGRITAGGAPLRYGSISIQNPVYGTHECSVHEEDVREQPPQPEERPKPVEAQPAAPAEGDSADGSDRMSSEVSIAPGEWYPYQGCTITIKADGTFSGQVTPGYSIIRVYADSWRDPDRVEYYSISRVVDLQSGQSSRVDFNLVAKPGPDSKLSGYVIDASTKQAIPGAQVSFSNQDSYGWADARTDKDGSYAVALRSGYTQVSVWAEGYLPWEGQVMLAAGDARRIDIEVTAGESLYGGGCCYRLAYEDTPMMAPAAMPMDGAESASPPPSAPASGSSGDLAEAGGDDNKNAFQDLGGGLGPYSPASDDATEGAPGFEILAVLMALAAVVLVMRRK